MKLSTSLISCLLFVLLSCGGSGSDGGATTTASADDNATAADSTTTQAVDELLLVNARIYTVNPENFRQVLRQCDLVPNSNGWVTAYGYSIQTLLRAMRSPKMILDEVYPNAPAIVFEETSHSLWANSQALVQAGINSASPNPVGGHIVKDASTGEPTGILLDNAGDLVVQLALAANPTINELNYRGLVEYSLPYWRSTVLLQSPKDVPIGGATIKQSGNA